MSNCFKSYLTSARNLASLVLLFSFWVPGVSADEFSFSISPSQNSVNEGDGSISIRAELSGGPSFDSSCRVIGEISVKESSVAKQGEDFEIIDGAFDLLIPQEQEWVNDLEPFEARSAMKASSLSSNSIEIKTIQDPHPESDEAIELIANIESEGCNPQVIQNEVTITIQDDDYINDFGSIHFDKNSYTVTEKEGTVTLKLNRHLGNTGSGPVTVTVSTIPGTASDGEDYVGISNKEINFEGELLSQEVKIEINSDGEVEEDESFTVKLNTFSGETSTEVTIKDSTIPGTAMFASSNYSGKEGEAAEIIVTREGGIDGELSVELAVGADGDTATAGKDYTKPESARLTWAAGDSEPKTISIPLLTDSEEDINEQVSLRLLEEGKVLDTATLTIEDIDPPNPGVVNFVRKTFSGEEGGLAEIQVMRKQGSDGVLSVELAVGAEGDTATAGKDYKKPESTQFTWAADDSETKTISIPLLTDGEEDVDEQVSLRLLQDGEVLDDATLTIKDIPPNLGVVKFVNKTFSGAEGSSVEVSVKREQGSEGELTVDLEIGADRDTATTGEDYKLPDNAQFIWAADDSETKTISIPLLKDNELEGVEQVSLRLLQQGEELDQAKLTINDTTVLGPQANVNTVEIISGKHQRVKTGNTLPFSLPSPFVIEALDANSNPISNVTVRWSIDPAGSGRLSGGGETITNVEGQSSNTFTVETLERVVITATISEGSESTPDGGRLQPRANNDLTRVFFVNGDIADTEALTQNERSVATTLDGACSSLDNKPEAERSGAEKDLLATCERMKNDQEANNSTAVAEGLKLLAPDEVISQGTAVIEASNLQVMNINSRLIAVRAGATGFVLSGLNIRIEDQTLPGYVINALVKGQAKGGAAGDVPGIAGRWGGFINGNISFGDKDDSDNETGFEFDLQGITIGADYRLSSQAVIGGAMGVTRNKSEFNGNAGKMDMDGVHLTAYGTYYQNERFYLDGLIKIGSNNYDTRRRVSRTGDLLQQAMGNTDGQEYSLSLSGGYKNNRGALNYGPYGRLSYTKAEIDAYTESASDPAVKGSGSVLSISDQDVDSLTAVFGGQLSYAISKPSGVYLPQARFEWEHQFSDDSRTLSAQFVHDPNSSVFGISTDDPDRDYFNLGLGMTMVIAGGKSGFVFYETRLDQENLTQHWIKGGIRIEFR